MCQAPPGRIPARLPYRRVMLPLLLLGCPLLAVSARLFSHRGETAVLLFPLLLRLRNGDRLRLLNRRLRVGSNEDVQNGLQEVVLLRLHVAVVGPPEELGSARFCRGEAGILAEAVDVDERFSGGDLPAEYRPNRDPVGLEEVGDYRLTVLVNQLGESEASPASSTPNQS